MSNEFENWQKARMDRNSNKFFKFRRDRIKVPVAICRQVRREELG